MNTNAIFKVAYYLTLARAQLLRSLCLEQSLNGLKELLADPTSCAPSNLSPLFFVDSRRTDPMNKI